MRQLRSHLPLELPARAGQRGRLTPEESRTLNALLHEVLAATTA